MRGYYGNGHNTNVGASDSWWHAGTPASSQPSTEPPWWHKDAPRPATWWKDWRNWMKIGAGVAVVGAGYYVVSTVAKERKADMKLTGLLREHRDNLARLARLK